jgi:Flp pilus assembly CpaF family ATPase
MRPDRIIVPEVSGKEAAALIDPLTSGIDGSIFTMHASSVRNALERFESYILSGSPTMPILSAREAMANGIQFIVYQERMPDGRRRITHITEILGLEGGILHMQDIFEFRQTGMKDGKITGHFSSTGLIPRRLGKMRDMGIDISMEMFVPKQG